MAGFRLGFRLGPGFRLGFKVGVRVRGQVGMVSVRGWVMHYAYDSPHKDRTSVCV